MNVTNARAAQIAEYKAVRARINGGPPAPPTVLIPAAARTAPPKKVVPQAMVSRQKTTPPPQHDAHVRAMQIVTRRHDPRLGAHVTILSIASATASYFGIDVEDIIGVRKPMKFVTARQIAAHLAREMTPSSFPMIGQRLRRDHSTILYACRSVASRIAAGDPIAQDVAAIRAMLVLA